MRNTSVKIDGAKLRKMFKERNLTTAEVSRELGFNESWLSRCLNHDYMTKIAVRGIELRYGIRGDDYIIPEPKPEPEREDNQIEMVLEQDVKAEPIDYDKLANALRDKVIDYQKLFATIYEAVRKAWVNE